MKHLKKVRGRIGRNIVGITMKMKDNSLNILRDEIVMFKITIYIPMFI